MSTTRKTERKRGKTMNRSVAFAIATCIALTWAVQAYSAETAPAAKAAPAAPKAMPAQTTKPKIPDGKLLMNKHCVTCHKSEVYTAKNRKVVTLETLKATVAKCSDASKTNWTDKEKETVVHYLNRTYYKFK
jgi:hypothetical protein